MPVKFDKDSGPPPPIICLFPLLNFLLLSIAPNSLLLVLVYGTIYLLTVATYFQAPTKNALISHFLSF